MKGPLETVSRSNKLGSCWSIVCQNTRVSISTRDLSKPFPFPGQRLEILRENPIWGLAAALFPASGAVWGRTCRPGR